ncbi:MAG TPA: peptidylprolyl isomerase, partial [Gammaproteobacteria bacterium]|nr:peptidylprolyl isomerase [Gammaproteobacteria bacterium]
TDALANEVRMDEAAMMAAIQSFVAEQQAAAEAAVAGNLEASAAFLAENGQQDG